MWGDIDLLTHKSHSLSWLESWILYYEFVYGRTHKRMRDYAKQWNINTDMVRAVVKEKLAMVIKVRQAWPKFVSIDEDESLRKSHWNEKMSGKRIRMIMHDMTDVPIDQPGDSELNRATFSKYYGGNCGKGGIFTQLCG